MGGDDDRLIEGDACDVIADSDTLLGVKTCGGLVRDNDLGVSEAEFVSVKKLTGG